jgi:linoleate 10R-lipoxygenase
MTIPSENAKIMKNLGRYHDYSFDKPEFIPLRVNLTSYSAAQHVLNRAQEFNVMWTEGFGRLMGKGGLDFCLSGDSDFHKKQKQVMVKSLYRDQWHNHVKNFYEWITLRLLHEKSCKVSGINQVNITREYVHLS